MKKVYLLVLMFFPAAVFAQQFEQENVFPRDVDKNELSIGALNLVAFGALDIAYERILTPYSSWAVEGFILALNRNSDDVSEVYNKDFSLTGKYKYFFGDNTAWGFYVNGLAMISTGEYRDEYDYYYNDQGILMYYEEEKRYTDLALGFGLGGKFVSRQGFFVDLNAGIGRNLLSSDSPTIVGQFNFNLGVRF